MASNRREIVPNPKIGDRGVKQRTVLFTIHCRLYNVGHRSLVRPENGTGLLREEPLQACHIPQRPMSYGSI
jgi:hypothetical protein